MLSYALSLNSLYYRTMQKLLRPYLAGLGVLLLSLSGGIASGAALPRHSGNSTLRMPPEPPRLGYTQVDAFPGLTFAKPVAVRSVPGETNRLFVIERSGRIIVITNLAAPTHPVFLDITSRVYADWEFGYAEGLASLAFHPGYATNRFFFVTYTLVTNSPAGTGNHNRLSRFQSSPTNPNSALANSELPLITQYDQGDGHNMNDLHFGPDGYLYVAVGDEGDGGAGDDFNNSQKIDKDFFSGILRIDVDRKLTNLLPNSHPATTTNYAVPWDNPFVGATNFNGHSVSPASVRTEFYAVGLRNPWRMSFDPLTGALLAGDVGQHGREEINLIVKGGNYGWANFEGALVGPKGAASELIGLTSPVHEYSPGFGPQQGFAVIGGGVYRGQRLSQLWGAYVFADYVSGNIWALRNNGSNTVERLMSDAGIAGFGADPRNGDVLVVDHDEGRIKRLIYNSNSTGDPIPPTLADTGAFAKLSSLTPFVGVVPYDVNVPFWSDNSRKKRWFSIPAASSTIGYNPEGPWTFPAGSVWIKHFDLQLTNGIAPVRRLETRLLVRNSGGVYGVTYRWGTSITNAVLVPEEGMSETFQIYDNGTVRTQVWNYPSRSDCLFCHSPAAGHLLGFNTAQLNRDYSYGSNTTNQILALSEAGYFSAPVSNIHSAPLLTVLTNSDYSVEHRARSYLAANCAQCHQPGGPARGYWDARITTSTSEAGIVGGHLFNENGNQNHRVVQPGSAPLSMLLTRMSQLGPLHMPPVGPSLIDTQAVTLIKTWITELLRYAGFASWQDHFFGSTTSAVASAFADQDQDGASNYLEYLTSGNPLDDSDPWKITVQRNGGEVAIRFPQAANRGFEIQFSYSPFDPSSWRVLDSPDNRRFFAATNRLGQVVDTLSGASAKFYRVRVYEP